MADAADTMGVAIESGDSNSGGSASGPVGVFGMDGRRRDVGDVEGDGGDEKGCGEPQ